MRFNGQQYKESMLYFLKVVIVPCSLPLRVNLVMKILVLLLFILLLKKMLSE